VQIPKQVRKSRAQETVILGERLHLEFLNKNLALSKDVLCEDKEDEYTVGYTDNYIKVYSDAQEGEIKSLMLKKIYKEGVLGI